jgi:DNA-binding NtrC family response regulator
MADTILLLQSDRAAGSSIRDLLGRSGADVVVAAAGSPALAVFDRIRPDLVVLDDPSGAVHMLDLLGSLVSRGAVVLAITAPGTPAATRALALGAEQLLVTSGEPDQVAAAVDRLRELVDLRREHEWSRARRLERGGLETLGSSTTMRTLAQQLERVAGTAGEPLLLVGEVGTGRGWVARQVHMLDPTRRGPFLDAGAPARGPTVTEAALCGREADDQGGQPRRVGLLEIAHRGSVYFREIADMELGAQSRLAGVLGGHGLRRVGGTRDLAVDVRVFAATTRDLAAAVQAGDFDAALLDRLGSHALRLPAVRERTREDRLALVDRLLVALGRQLPGVPTKCTPEAAEHLISGPWPGNVRELRAVLERALLLSRGATRLGVQYLPADLSDGRAAQDDFSDRTPPVPLVEVEREHIVRALRYHHGNRTRAAHDLGISRATLINKIKVYSLDL